MTEFRRLISYLYEYEGRVKGKNVGFVKLETRNGLCKLNISIRKLYMGSGNLGIYLLSARREIFLGNLVMRNGGGEFRTTVQAADVEQSGESIDSCYGLTIYEKKDSWKVYTTIWEDSIAQAAELMPSQTQEGGTEKKTQMPAKDSRAKALAEVAIMQAAEVMLTPPKERLFAPANFTTESRDERGGQNKTEILENFSESKEAKPSEKEVIDRESPENPNTIINLETVKRDRNPEIDGDKKNLEIRENSENQENSKNQENTKNQGNIKSQENIENQRDAGNQENIGNHGDAGNQENIENQGDAGSQKNIENQGDAGSQKNIGNQGDAENQEDTKNRRNLVMNETKEAAEKKEIHTGMVESTQTAGLLNRPQQTTGNRFPRSRMNSYTMPSRRPMGLPRGNQQPLPQQTLSQQPLFQEPLPQQPLSQQPLPQQSLPQQPLSQQPLPQQPLPQQPLPQQPLPRQPFIRQQQEEPLIIGDPEALAKLEEEEKIPPVPLWNFLSKTYPKIQAFESQYGCEILVIKPQDIGLLPREVWIYGNNSFLLHGYYNYRYLILARLENPQGPARYLLGVPGHYYNNEKYMASMFGFANFVLSKKQQPQDGRFGYWYTDIRLEDQHVASAAVRRSQTYGQRE